MLFPLPTYAPPATRPNQHSASWWPRLLADDATDVAWDDTHKDYTDLPPAIAAAAAAEAAREDEAARRHQERREARDKLQVRGGVIRRREFGCRLTSAQRI